MSSADHLVVLSGGLDSTTCLALAVAATPGRVATLGFDYGQRHAKEQAAARDIAAHYGVVHRVVDLKGLLAGSALLYEHDVPQGHYAEQSMAATVVQGRNLLFAAVAIAATRAEGAVVHLGVHAGDHFIYPDCRPAFWEPLTALVEQAYGVHLATPLLHLTKAQGVAAGASLAAPLHLSWSCYLGDAQHCGRCGTCVERAEAFAIAHVPDPTTYADPAYWRRAVANAVSP